ncbi:FAD-dependent oxidoreductase [Oryzobacter sp. R7]|uniref:FAD-dependent oxidoreductase n=1 Tax=Oryzobacter faecalis TaxID=3388656 RepID=UPI00398CAAB3
MDADVVVVGAGLAGLRCATRLAEAGRDVVVLEAGDVVGGRQRTDAVDGFLLDRGFQVLNPAYPAVRRWVDVEALGLRPFGPGLLVRRDRGLVRLTHPLRDPSGVPAALRSGLLDPAALLALARWAGPAVVAPRRVLRGPDRPLRAGLDSAGVRGPLRTEVLEPFLAGVLAEDVGETSESFARLLVRMFALGLPGLPADGIRALPAQLADRLPPGRAAVRLSTPVAAVRDTGSGAVVELEDGGRVVAGAAVVAVGPEAVGALVDVPAPATKGLRTWWFSADEAPTDSDLLAVDGRRDGPVVNLAVVSNAVPSYAPAGRHLVEATCLLPPGGADGAAQEAVVRRQAGEVLGADASRWTLLRRDDIRHALPVQAPPLRTTTSPFVTGRVLVCGDHRDTASIQGALVSGHRVAGAVLGLLGPGA